MSLSPEELQRIERNIEIMQQPSKGTPGEVIILIEQIVRNDAPALLAALKEKDERINTLQNVLKQFDDLIKDGLLERNTKDDYSAEWMKGACRIGFALNDMREALSADEESK